MCDRCGHDKALAAIENIFAKGTVVWAHSFLISTRRWISTNKHVTQPQVQALRNIAKKAGFKDDVQKDSRGKRRQGSGLFS